MCTAVREPSGSARPRDPAACGRPSPAPARVSATAKGPRGARTWDGQPPAARKVTRHSTHLDAAVTKPHVSVRRAFARSRAASRGRSTSAKPSTTQKRRTSRPHGARNPSPTSHERRATTAAPSAIPARDGTTPPAPPDRACPPPRKGPRVLASRFCGRPDSRGMRHVTASVPLGHRMGRWRRPAGSPAAAIPRSTARRRTARGGRWSARSRSPAAAVAVARYRSTTGRRQRRTHVPVATPGGSDSLGVSDDLVRRMGTPSGCLRVVLTAFPGCVGDCLLAGVLSPGMRGNGRGERGGRQRAVLARYRGCSGSRRHALGRRLMGERPTPGRESRSLRE
ncbi:hypothetical protein EHYA_05532 [Embleya hyalina]|uniref:Uncharacterized protein n=1 Tax=Embleya hyalina TaxID=516124 RepID=A0A401YTF9_9ACTN|nr:hypothetical protein EHYA_05532 [Embleya hyalina]